MPEANNKNHNMMLCIVIGVIVLYVLHLNGGLCGKKTEGFATPSVIGYDTNFISYRKDPKTGKNIITFKGDIEVEGIAIGNKNTKTVFNATDNSIIRLDIFNKDGEANDTSHR